MALGLPVDGWLPKGRRAEDGPLPERYPLRESGSPDYPHRTRLNVRHADATLILGSGPLTGGTGLTLAIARELERPCRIVDLDQRPDPAATLDWLDRVRPAVLNVAGPRESTAPGIYRRAGSYLAVLFAAIRRSP